MLNAIFCETCGAGASAPLTKLTRVQLPDAGEESWMNPSAAALSGPVTSWTMLTTLPSADAAIVSSPAVTSLIAAAIAAACSGAVVADSTPTVRVPGKPGPLQT